jgi:hypothetical protein
MRLLSRLEDGQKSCAIWHILFRQSPKPAPTTCVTGSSAGWQ